MGRAEHYTSENIIFHRRIYEAADNEYLLAQLPIVAMTSQVFMPAELIVHARAGRAVGEHEAILAASQAGDGDRAERIARVHIHNTIDSLSHRGVRV